MRAYRIALYIMMFFAVTNMLASLAFFTAADVTTTQTDVDQWNTIDIDQAITPQEEESFGMLKLLRLGFKVLFDMIYGALVCAKPLIETFGVPVPFAVLINIGVLVLFAVEAANWLSGSRSGSL